MSKSYSARGSARTAQKNRRRRVNDASQAAGRRPDVFEKKPRSSKQTPMRTVESSYPSKTNPAA
jgi:hypothetical protein